MAFRNLSVEETSYVPVELTQDLIHKEKKWYKKPFTLCCLNPSSHWYSLGRDEHIQALMSVLTLRHLSDNVAASKWVL